MSQPRGVVTFFNDSDLSVGKDEHISIGTYPYGAALVYVAGKQLFRQVIEQVALYGPFYGARTEFGVEPCLCYVFYGAFVALQCNIALLQ